MKYGWGNQIWGGNTFGGCAVYEREGKFIRNFVLNN
jgi:hypothetical protein